MELVEKKDSKLGVFLVPEELPFRKSIKIKTWRKLTYLGCFFVFLGTITYLTDPVDHVYDWSMRIKPSSRFLGVWSHPPINIFIKIYIFNVTNPKPFLAGKEKLRLQEIGPFVYQETLTNTVVSFNDNNTMTYLPRRSVKFIREKSVADPASLKVVVPNLALLGLASMLANSSMVTNLGLLSVIRYLGSKPFLHMTVHDYFWGYEDPLIDMAHTVVSGWIPFAKLGLVDRMYDEGDNLITIRLRDNGLDVSDPGYLPQYSIDNWNGSPGLKQWGYNEQDFCHREEPLRPNNTERCKLIKGATEGSLFPRNLNPEVTNYVYRKTFCRHTPVKFMKSDSFMPGIEGHWYGLPIDVFDRPEDNQEQRCYCNPDRQKCLPRGLSDITPCYYNIPAAVSFPHFLNGDPSLVEAIDGIKPEKEKHDSDCVIQPNLGSVLNFTSRIQTNLVMNNIRYNTELIPFSNLHIPFFWVEMSTDGLPVDIVISIYVLLVILPALQTITIITGAVSAALLVISAVFFLFLRKCLKQRVVGAIK